MFSTTFSVMVAQSPHKGNLWWKGGLWKFLVLCTNIQYSPHTLSLEHHYSELVLYLFFFPHGDGVLLITSPPGKLSSFLVNPNLQSSFLLLSWVLVLVLWGFPKTVTLMSAWWGPGHCGQ